MVFELQLRRLVAIFIELIMTLFEVHGHGKATERHRHGSRFSSTWVLQLRPAPSIESATNAEKPPRRPSCNQLDACQGASLSNVKFALIMKTCVLCFPSTIPKQNNRNKPERENARSQRGKEGGREEGYPERYWVPK